MIRKIIHIDQESCNGCGLCAEACHEGAIAMVNGKARLIRDDYCDGLGDCLPVCPTGAISFEEREAAPYDQAAVEARQKGREPLPCGCPGTQAKAIQREEQDMTAIPGVKSQLRQWPVQIKLVPSRAPYLQHARLLIAADCTAFAYGNFHQEFIKDHICVIGCPKLDEGDYSQKLTEILMENAIESVTVVRMEVPCCGGIASAARTAIAQSGKDIPYQVVTIATDGQVVK